MSKLLNFLKFLLLIAACFGLTFIVVWPLWKFATSLPNIYTITILTFIAVGLILSVVKGIKKHVKK